jgi:hypothetical protein
MEKSNTFRSLLNGRRQRNFKCALALFIAGVLLIVGCSKNNGTGNSSSPSKDTPNGSNGTARSGKESREEMKGMADQQGQATAPDRGNFKVVYSSPQNEKYAQMNENLRQTGALEELADELNSTIAIPEDVTITFKECGKINAWWDPRERSINMCFELMEDMAERFKPIAKSDEELQDAVGGAVMFAIFHEMGHGLIDLLKLPSTGKEEDAVDQLATYVLIDSSGDQGEKMALNGAMWWGRQYEEMAQSGKTTGDLDQLWANEHSFDAQRFYNIVCWVYGHDPDKYRNLVNNPLPEQRAVRCPQEYGRLSNAWATLLKPYLKNGGANAATSTQASNRATGND